MFRSRTRWLASLTLLAAASFMSLSIAHASGEPGGGGASGGSGGGSGSGGGGGSAFVPCGTLTAQPYTFVLYTTRTGIGVGGTATNCSTKQELFTVDVTDITAYSSPSCVVLVPHYTSIRNTPSGGATSWSASSTLVNCQGMDHTFQVQLSANGVVVATTTVTQFL